MHRERRCCEEQAERMRRKWERNMGRGREVVGSFSELVSSAMTSRLRPARACRCKFARNPLTSPSINFHFDPGKLAMLDSQILRGILSF
jgi:hypothetical protein